MNRRLSFLCWLLLFLDAPRLLAEPGPAATAGFNTYTQIVEERLVRQHRTAGTFLPATTGDASLRNGNLVIEDMNPSGSELSGALLHHWRGTGFAPGAHAADFERLLRDFNAYPKHFAPEVVSAHTLTQAGDRMSAAMRVRQHHVITVVMDTAYDIDFGRLDLQHGYSLSRSTHIAEIASPGSPAEHALSSAEEHGFIWRLNTYWSYEERDGGLYMQIESVSLSRAIPRGLAWAVGPFVESVPRESLEFTLRSTCNAFGKQ